MSKIFKKNKEKHLKSIGDHHKFLSRITKTLYYGKVPATERLSLPVTELAAEVFSEAQNGRSLERLHCNDAAIISRNACISPCSFVLAMLYLERLKSFNPEYLQCVAPSELFLVLLMVSSKFLYDDGQDDEVFMDEWATSGGISVKEMIRLEKEFLNAIEWKIFVDESTFWQKLGNLETTVARNEGLRRGWFTYTELQSLLGAIDIYNFIQTLVAFSTILVATYTAGILTLTSSMFIVSNIPGNCLQSRNVTEQAEESYIAVERHNHDEIEDGSIHILNTLNKNSFTVDIPQVRNSLKPLDAVDVLKTGILLASIKTVPDVKTHCNKSSVNCDTLTNVADKDNVEIVTWDWWSSPAMDWLTRTSELIENFDFMPKSNLFSYIRYLDVAMANNKIRNLEDQIHKASKVRLQDQLERTWHKEWTDVIRNGLFRQKLFSYFQDIKS